MYQETAPYMLADGVIRIFEDEELAIQLGNNAYTKANEIYDKEKNLQKLLEIYEYIDNIKDN